MKKQHRRKVISKVKLTLESLAPDFHNWRKENDLRLIFRVVRIHHFTRSFFVLGLVVAGDFGEGEIVVRIHPKSALYDNFRELLKDEVIDFFSKVKARDFYNTKFERLFFYEFRNAADEYVPEQEEFVCRFCENKNGAVTFEKRAHAVPELVGNRALLTRVECDSCNETFGRGIEQELADYTLVERNIFRVLNKDGLIPSIVQRKWSIRADAKTTYIYIDSGKTLFTFDFRKKKATLKVPSKSYTPALVLKSLLKMALCLLSEKEFLPYQSLARWILKGDESNMPRVCTQVIRTIFPIGSPLGVGHVLVLKKRDENELLPDITFVLSYKNVSYQVCLIKPNIATTALTMTPFAFCYQGRNFDKENSSFKDMGSFKRQNDGIVTVSLKMEGPVIRGRM